MEDNKIRLIVLVVYFISAVTANPAERFTAGIRHNRKDLLESKVPFDDEETDSFSGDSNIFDMRFNEPFAIPGGKFSEKSPTEVELFLPDDDDLNDSMNLDDIYGTGEFDRSRKPGMLQSSFDGTDEKEEDLETIADEDIWNRLQDYGIFPNTYDYYEEPIENEDDVIEEYEESTTASSAALTTSVQGSPSTVGESLSTTDVTKAATTASSQVLNSNTESSSLQRTQVSHSEPKEEKATESEIMTTTIVEKQTHGIDGEKGVSVDQKIGATSTAANTKPATSQSTKAFKPDTEPVLTTEIVMETKSMKKSEETSQSSSTATLKRQPPQTTTEAAGAGSSFSSSKSTVLVEDAVSVGVTVRTERLPETMESSTPGMAVTKEVLISTTKKSNQPEATSEAPVMPAASGNEITKNISDEPIDVTIAVTVRQLLPKEDDRKGPGAPDTFIRGDEQTTEVNIAPAQTANFPTIVLIACIISLVIVLILVVVIIIIVRARLKKRGKYEITSDVDSTEAATPGEGDVAQNSGAKAVVTVQYNDSRA